MSPDAVASRVVLACVRGDAWRSPSSTLQTLVEAADLREVPSHASRHGVSGYAWHALSRFPALDPAVRSELRAHHYATVHSHLQVLDTLRSIAGTLAAAAPAWAVLKGPVLAETLHPRPDLRSYSDLDVLVGARDFKTAVEALEAAGCTVLARDWDAMRAGMIGELQLRASAGGLIDLHWHVVNEGDVRAAYRIDVRALLERARTVVLDGMEVRTLDAADTLIHLALHACRSGGDRLVWFKDIEVSIVADRPDWDVVVARARSARVGLPVSLMLRAAAGLVGAPVPQDVLRSLAPSRQWERAARLALRIAPPERASGEASVARMVFRATRASVPSSGAALARHACIWARHRLVGGDIRTGPSSATGDRDAFLDAVSRA